MTDTYAGATVLVTGADGFIGSHLVEHLVGLGAKVRALVYYNSWNSNGWLSDVAAQVLESVEIVRGDVRDARLVDALVDGATHVFHLASLIGIPYSYGAAQSYIDTNVYGTLNLLEACRRSQSLIRLVHTSTSEVYGTAQQVPMDEDHPITAQSPYAASKAAADKLAQSFHLSFGVPVVTARPFNTFGPRQTARAVIPTIITQLLRKGDELRLGALSPTRDFTYVSDTAKGFVALGGCQFAEGEVVNMGTGEEHSIEETARILMQLCGHEVPIICENERLRPEKSEVERLVANPQKMINLTSWRAGWTFAAGLEATVAWWRCNEDRLPDISFAS